MLNLNLKKMSNSELVSQLKHKVLEERKSLTEILHMIQEVESRRLYSLYEYSSLFAFVTKELGYDESSAYRRIEAARLLKSLPTQESKKVETSLEQGKLNLTNLSSLNGFMRKKESKSKKRLSTLEKTMFIDQIENKSTRECQVLLAQLDPELSPDLREKEKALAGDKTELKIIVSNTLLEKLRRVQELRAHANPNMSYAEILEYMAEVVLDKTDPERKWAKKEKKEIKTSIATNLSVHKESAAQNEKSLPAAEVTGEKNSDKLNLSAANSQQAELSKDTLHKKLLQTELNKNNIHKNLPETEFNKNYRPTIPAHIKQAVYHRDQGRCTYVSPETGRACGSRFGLEFEHKIPVAKNGKSDTANLTLHCHAHNMRTALNEFGEEKMREFIDLNAA